MSLQEKTSRAHKWPGRQMVSARACARTSAPDQATAGAALSEAVIVATEAGTRGASAHISS